MPFHNAKNNVVANIKYLAPNKFNKYLGHTKSMDGQKNINNLVALLKDETFLLYTSYLNPYEARIYHSSIFTPKSNFLFVTSIFP